MQLSFDYSRDGMTQTAYYNGDAENAQYRVTVERDDCPENPFESWGGHWPMIVDYQDRGHNFRTYDNAPGPSLDTPFEHYSDGQIIRHQKAIASALDIDLASIHADCIDDQKWDRERGYTVASMADLKRDYFERELDNVSDSDKLETLAALYDIIGIPALCTSSHGYSQGDYVELLIVATPEAQAQFGWKPNSRTPEQVRADMEAQSDLYGFWAWGDVYSYSIELRDGDDPDEWEWLDSCAGFYGDDHEKSGLAEQAIASLEYHIEQAKRSHFAKLKELIRANVPYGIRADILASKGF